MSIKLKRIKALMSQKDLAKRLGVTQGLISQWETGKVHPRATMLPKLADILGCTVDELLREEAS